MKYAPQNKENDIAREDATLLKFMEKDFNNDVSDECEWKAKPSRKVFF